MAYKTPPASYKRFEGEMLTPLPGDGERTTTSQESESELIIDFSQPLQEILNAICSHQGKLIMAFPSGSSVKIKFTNYHGRDPSGVYKLGFPDIKAELVTILYQTVPGYITQIKNKLEQHGHHPASDDIQLVKVISSVADEALSVDLDDKRVYFKVFTPNAQDLDDSSIFIRVRIYNPGAPSTMILWINLSTLLPIARESGTNKLYAIVPQITILPPINHPKRSICQEPLIMNDFDWLDAVLQNPDDYHSTCLFYEEGAEQVKIHPIKDPPDPPDPTETDGCPLTTQGLTMISKGASCSPISKEALQDNANAVLSDALMRFKIHHYKFEEVLGASNITVTS